MLQIPTYNLFSLLTRRYHIFKVCSFYFSGTQNFVDFHQAVNWLASQRSIKPIGPMIDPIILLGHAAGERQRVQSQPLQT
jgi:hypothetical protein